MNEADASPGGGAVTVAPAEPTAAPTAPSLDVDSLMSRLSGVIDEKLAAHKNSTFAELRKAGAFKQDKPQGEPSTAASQPTQSAPAVVQAGLSMADVEALLERKGTVASRAAKYGLSDAQTKRFEAAMSGVPRESLPSEADAYLADMGLAKAPPQPATQPAAQAAPAQPAKPNISDRGSASPTDMRDSTGVLHSRPLEMTGHDVDDLILKHGETKGLQMFQERVLSALKGVRIKPPRG